MTNATVEGQPVKVGDFVGFKSDYEQSGEIVKIEGTGESAVLHLHDPNGFGGEYLRYSTDTKEIAENCWLLTQRARTIMIISCGDAKLDGRHAARDLYQGQLFKSNIRAAEIEAEAGNGEVWILSAKHGLIRATDVIDSYDVKMGDENACSDETISETLSALIEDNDDCYFMGAVGYFDRLNAIAQEQAVYVSWVNEADAGVGYMRGTARQIREIR